MTSTPQEELQLASQLAGLLQGRSKASAARVVNALAASLGIRLSSALPGPIGPRTQRKTVTSSRSSSSPRKGREKTVVSPRKGKTAWRQSDPYMRDLEASRLAILSRLKTLDRGTSEAESARAELREAEALIKARVQEHNRVAGKRQRESVDEASVSPAPIGAVEEQMDD